MSYSDRRDRIVEYLRIKPISHGQVHTELIAIPKNQQVEISPERHESLKRSLTEQGSNLIPLIIRRTEDYSEEEGYEYEVVYGADWCLVAKESNIEKLWVWVFDLNDEQAAAAKAEMENLIGLSSRIPSTETSPKPDLNSEKELIQKLYEQQLLINEQLKEIHQKLERIIPPPPPVITTPNQATGAKAKTKAKTPPPGNKVNLTTATKAEIVEVLNTKTQAEASWKAIQHWKQPGKILTWENLQKSTKQGKDKIKDFADGTYEKLRDIGYIPDVESDRTNV